MRALCLFALGLAAFMAQPALASPPMRYVGVVDNIVTSTDPQVTQVSMGKARDAGYNTVRVIMSWNYPWQHDVGTTDQTRICNTALAAASNGMVLFLDLVTVAPSGKFGAPPDRGGQITFYDQTVNDYLWLLIGPNGCAQNLPELDIEIGNEPNYSVFCQPVERCAAMYAKILSRTYGYLKDQVSRISSTVPVHIVAGELASSHDPVGFIADMNQALAKLNTVGPLFDMFSYHCYGVSGLAPTPPDAVRQALKQYLGWTGPLLCSEYGVSTVTTTSGPRSTQGNSEALQAGYAHQVMQMGACAGLAGVMWFHLMDDPLGKGLQTGLYNYNSNPATTPWVAKASLPGFGQANASATSGGFNCG